MTNEFYQKRARAGGERGPNGEWYEGGKFIATKDNPKSSPRKWEPTPEERAAWEAKKAAEEARIARFDGWLAGRRAQFQDLIKDLIERDRLGYGRSVEEWKEQVRNGAAGFSASLGYQLLMSGDLSPRQADCACKIYFGRQNKKNLEEWEALREALTERFQFENPAA